jgi:hypothetical protein
VSAEFGVNVAPGGTDTPAAGVGAWRRMVLSGPQHSTIGACAAYHRAGARVLGVVTRQVTVEQAGGSAAQTARRILDLFGPSIDGLQVGNEPDGAGVASDVASVAVYNEWLAAFRTATAAVRWAKPLVAAGLVSGQPDFLKGVDMRGYLLAVHPYDQRIGIAGDWGWGDLASLLDAYRPYLPAGTGFWLTECSRTTEHEAVQAAYAAHLPRAIAARTDVAACLWYCWQDWYLGTERQPFGLTRTDGSAKPALGAWIEGVQMATKTLPPWQKPEWAYPVGEGVGWAMQARNDEPKGPEVYLPDGLNSFTPGAKFMYTYNKTSNLVYLYPKA